MYKITKIFTIKYTNYNLKKFLKNNFKWRVKIFLLFNNFPKSDFKSGLKLAVR